MPSTKKVSMAVIPNMLQWDDQCPLHQHDPFGVQKFRRVPKPFESGRTIAPWEWMDADKHVCTCIWEKAEAHPRKSPKGAAPRRKSCPTCFMVKPLNGQCGC